MFAVWTKGATLNHYPYNIRHRFIGEMERWVGGTWGTRRVSNDSCGECCLRFRQICWVWDPLLSFLLHRFSPLQRSCQSISPSPSLCSLQFLMFYNLVCFGWIKWNFNLDFEFGYVLHDLGFIFLGMFFRFKICVNGERDKCHFLILFLLPFCSIFCFGGRET